MSSSHGRRPIDIEEAESPPPPDGGYGWICVVAQFLINGFTWGVAASYSVYLAYYLSHDQFADGSTLDFALIGGFNFAFALLVAPLATLIARLYGVRAPMALGVVLFPAAFIGASFATRAWHLYLLQGMCIGIAIGLIYIPSTAIIPQWFLKKRSLANGICAAGSGIGGLIICFATQGMLANLGLPWSLRITAIVVFLVNSAATLLVRSRNEEVKPDQQIFNFRLLRSYHAMLLLGWSFVMMFGYITLMFSLSDYALATGRSGQDSATVAALLNLGAAVGRPMIGYLSDRYGRVEVAGLLTAICGVLVFVLWLPISVYSILLIFALIDGSILGVFWAVIGPLSADIVGLKELPAFLSIVWLSVALPSAAAEVISLELRRPKSGGWSYLHTQILAGLSYIVSSLFLFELWRSRRAKKETNSIENTEEYSS
ncbi:MFS transporter, MCP family, solute carrier family 16, member 6 [Hypomontagnella monticulosa]|nr:MFS transporter, MCP family, solute carrier family 16, member 6 [Hypomontagnella monticulosa]